MSDIDPAFLVEAEILLQDGNAREAAELCTRGLVKYPEYFTAYKILTVALEEMGDTVQRDEVIESAPNLVRIRLEATGNYVEEVQTLTLTQPEEIEVYEPAIELEIEDFDDYAELEEAESSHGNEETEEEPEVVEDYEVINEESDKGTTEVETIELEQEIEEEQSENSEEILNKEINKAIRNDKLNPELLHKFTKNKEELAEEIDIKETLTLAKIYEQQDAYQEALTIYQQLQEITEDKTVYADKITELTALVSEG